VTRRKHREMLFSCKWSSNNLCKSNNIIYSALQTKGIYTNTADSSSSSNATAENTNNIDNTATASQNQEQSACAVAVTCPEGSTTVTSTPPEYNASSSNSIISRLIPVIASYELNYQRGRVIALGIYSEDIISNGRFDRYLDSLLLQYDIKIRD
jgi:hypothetical protein